jgi:prepilin peptidase CpaA
MVSTLPMLLLVAVAATCDLRIGKIPNALILVGLVTGLCLAVVDRGAEGLITALAGFGLGFILLLPGYLMRFTGAGDLKLLTTLGVFSGPSTLLVIFSTSVVAGAMFILLKATWRTLRKHSLFSRHGAFTLRHQSIPTQFNHNNSNRHSIFKQRLPMAPFYALGCTIFFILQLIERGG